MYFEFDSYKGATQEERNRKIQKHLRTVFDIGMACCGCGAHFTTQYAINAHCEQDINYVFAGWTGSPGWNEVDTSWDEVLNAISKAVKKLK